MAAELSRRKVIAGLATSAVVVGWNPLSQSWVTAAGAAGSQTVPVPPLDGALLTGPDVLANFAHDFGRFISRTPTAVLRPGSVQDIQKIVCYARANGLKVAMNGQSGSDDRRESHSNYGQALVQGGIVIDQKPLSTIHSIGSTTADVGAGVTWAQLTQAAAAQGKTPPMLTDYLHLSIGGMSSVGGMGGTAHRFGAQVDNVVELQVVTGKGDLVTCSQSQNAVLFNAVLAGVGQCGLIVRAKVKLVPAPTNARVFDLFYNDLSTYMADATRALNDPRVSFLDGQLVRKADDSGWRFNLTLATYYTPPATPDEAGLLAGLSDERAEAQILDLPYIQWAFRLDPIIAQLKTNPPPPAPSFWDVPHPWVSLFLPASRTADFMTSVVLPQLTQADMGVGRPLFFPLSSAKFTRPLFVQPQPRESVHWTLSLLRFNFPGTDNTRLLNQNRTFFDAAVARGGKRYVIGAIPNMTKDDWARHYGSVFSLFKAAKRTFDPDNILTPGQGIF